MCRAVSWREWRPSGGKSVKSLSPGLSLKPSPLFSPHEDWTRELFPDRQPWCLPHIPTACQTLALGCSFCILPVDNMTPISCLISWVVSRTTHWPARAFCERSEAPSCLAALDRIWEITANLRSQERTPQPGPQPLRRTAPIRGLGHTRPPSPPAPLMPLPVILALAFPTAQGCTSASHLASKH